MKQFLFVFLMPIIFFSSNTLGLNVLNPIKISEFPKNILSDTVKTSAFSPSLHKKIDPRIQKIYQQYVESSSEIQSQ